MASITRFEDIEAWKKARELTREVYRISENGALGRNFGLKDQIQRAAVSSMSNIAEGFERGGNRELIQFLSVAKGSAGETKSLLYVALDNQLVTQDDFQRILDLATQTCNLIGGFMRYIESSPVRGPKYKQRDGKA
jgi:four helix bundle protein